MARVATGCEDQGLQPRKPLGQILLEMGAVSSAQLQEALKRQQEQIVPRLGVILVKLGYATRAIVYQALARQFSIPFISLADLWIPLHVLKAVPAREAFRNVLVPIAADERSVTVALSEPQGLDVLEHLRATLNCGVTCVLATPEDVRNAILCHYPKVATMGMPAERLPVGEILQQMGSVSGHEVREALQRQHERPRKMLGEILVELGHATVRDVYEALAWQLMIPFMALDQLTIDPAVINLVPRSVAVENRVCPVKADGKTVTLAVADPLDLFTLDNLQFILNLNLDCVLATPDDVLDAIRRHYPAE